MSVSILAEIKQAIVKARPQLNDFNLEPLIYLEPAPDFTGRQFAVDVCLNLAPILKEAPEQIATDVYACLSPKFQKEILLHAGFLNFSCKNVAEIYQNSIQQDKGLNSKTYNKLLVLIAPAKYGLYHALRVSALVALQLRIAKQHGIAAHFCDPEQQVEENELGLILKTVFNKIYFQSDSLNRMLLTSDYSKCRSDHPDEAHAGTVISLWLVSFSAAFVCPEYKDFFYSLKSKIPKQTKISSNLLKQNWLDFQHSAAESEQNRILERVLNSSTKQLGDLCLYLSLAETNIDFEVAFLHEKANLGYFLESTVERIFTVTSATGLDEQCSEAKIGLDQFRDLSDPELLRIASLVFSLPLALRSALLKSQTVEFSQLLLQALAQIQLQLNSPQLRKKIAEEDLLRSFFYSLGVELQQIKKVVLG